MRDPFLQQLLAALCALRPHRIRDPGTMQADDILDEHIIYNARIRRAGGVLTERGGGRSLVSRLQAAAHGRPVRCLRDILPLAAAADAAAPAGAAGAAGASHAASSAAFQELLECLPLAWRQALGAGAAAATAAAAGGGWQCTTDRAFAVSPDGTWFVLAPDGLVARQCSAPLALQAVQLAPLRIVQLSGRLRYAALTGCPAAPGTWGCGGLPLHELTCKGAYQRLLRLRYKAAHPEFNVAAGVRPALWPAPGEAATAGLQQLEGKLQRSLWLKQHPHARGPASPPDYSQGAAWLDLSRPPPARLQRGERLAASAAAEDDSLDALTGVGAWPPLLQDALVPAAGAAAPTVDEPLTQPAPAPEWHFAWRRAALRVLPADVRVFGFKLLHGTLFTGAFHSHVCRSLPLDQCRPFCSFSSCAGQEMLEGLCHVFMDCPRVAPVIHWLRGVWAAVSGEWPPLCAAVLLADHSPSWQAPTRQLRELWTILRLCTLHAIWSTRAAAAANGDPLPPASAVVAVAVKRVRRLILLDYTRVLHDVRCLTGAVSVWFAGRDPRMELDDFVARWCHNSVLARFVSGDLDIRLSDSWPVGVVDLQAA